jgi:NTP pyrophosphatase (non-canonical NTP hydrolase)
MMETQREVCRKALDTYGSERQMKKLFEEIGELQEALCKYTDGRDTVEHLAEEIADVQIMLAQMAILHDCVEKVAEFKQAKLARLEGRLDHDHS